MFYEITYCAIKASERAEPEETEENRKKIPG